MARTEEEKLTLQELATTIGIKESTLRNWTRPHILKGGRSNPRYLQRVQDSKTIEFYKSTVLAWLEKNQDLKERIAGFLALHPDLDDLEAYVEEQSVNDNSEFVEPFDPEEQPQQPTLLLTPEEKAVIDALRQPHTQEEAHVPA